MSSSFSSFSSFTAMMRGALARRVAVIATVLAAAAAPLACRDASGPRSPVGSYGLATVNAKALPARLFADTGFTVDIADGSLAIQSDGKYILGLTSRWMVEGNLSTYVDADTGTWSRSGNHVTLTTSDSTTQSGTWDATRLTLVDSTGADVMTYVFVRR